MAQFHFDPATYLESVHREVPAYERLQSAVVAATGALRVRRFLDLGVGTGETACRVLARHPGARAVGVDASAGMLDHARRALPGADLRVARLQDALPEGRFDLVVSALAVHHLDGAGKADLFRRVARVLDDEGGFVLGDVIVPDDPDDAITPIEPGFDRPSRLDEQLGWLADAGLDPQVTWSERDLVVVRCARLTVGSRAGR